MEDSPETASANIPEQVGYSITTKPAPVKVNSFMRFNLLRRSGEGAARQMVYKEDKSLNAVNVWGAPAIHPPSLLHSLSVWPYPTCMTPDHSSSL